MDNQNLQQDFNEKARERDGRLTKFIVFLVLWILSGIIFWIIWFLSALALGWVGVLFGWIIGLGVSTTFLVLWIYNLVKWINLKNECEEIERQLRTGKIENFWCGICHTKYQAEFLGGETAHEGKICRSCLGKRQRGETIYSQPPNQNQPKEEFYSKPFQPERGTDTTKDREKRILLRELSRKQKRKNGYLTQFIINLAVLQWLLPLLTILFFWLGLKEQIKVEAMKNPSLGLPTEIPFKIIFKDIFKILTSEFYTYGGYNVSIGFAWKLGIILTLLLPLGFWIYYLVRFLGANGEIKQLETEIKELE